MYGEEVIVSSEAPQQRGSERIREERKGQQTRTEDDELKHNNQHNVGMNGSPPFSNMEDEGKL